VLLPPRRLLRSTGAVLLGLLAVVVLSPGTDQVLHVLEVYPPWSQSMHDPGGLVLSLAGAIATMELGPDWYPIALVLTALPCAWLGGVLHRAWHAEP